MCDNACMNVIVNIACANPSFFFSDTLPKNSVLCFFFPFLSECQLKSGMKFTTQKIAVDIDNETCCTVSLIPTCGLEQDESLQTNSIMKLRGKRKARAPTRHSARRVRTKHKRETTKPINPIQARIQEIRNDPKERGVHKDAIQAGIAPSRASACVACDNKIDKHGARWGIKYAGNPLSIPVLPLYGSHPMVQWCHAGGCGLAFTRYSDMTTLSPAARTCHACQDAPDKDLKGIRLLCGAPQKGQKIRHHVFHIACWIRSIQEGSDPSIHAQLIVKPEDIGAHIRKQKKLGGLSWDDLTLDERDFVSEEFQRMGCL